MCTKNMKLPQMFLYAVFSITTPVRNRLGTEKAPKLVVREPRAPNKANRNIVRQSTKFDMIEFYKILINILV